MDAGTRVLITKSNNNFFLGTVVTTVGDQAHISLDMRPFDPSVFIQLPVSLLVSVNHWTMQSKSLKYDNIKVDKKEDPHFYFLSKKNIPFDLAAVRAMWCWTNQHLFNHALKTYPHFNDFIPPEDAKKIGYGGKNKLLGLFFSRGSRSGHLEISINMRMMLTMFATFSTVVHEMVHQENWEVKHADGHGKIFLDWQEAVQSICKVKLDVKGDLAEREADFEKEDINIPDNNKNYYVLMVYYEGKYVAVGSMNLDYLENLRDYLSVNGKNTVYLRKMNNAKLRGLINFITTPTKKVRNWTLLPPDLSNLIIEQGSGVYSRMLKVYDKCC